MPAITDTQLFNLSRYLTYTDYIYYPIVKYFNSDMFNLGTRPNELLNPSLFTNNHDGTVSLQPLKGNNTRTLAANLFSYSLINAISTNSKPYQGLTLRQIESVNKKILPVATISAGNKSAISYLFRYNYTRELKRRGLTDAEIQVEMGWNNLSLVSSYLNRSIFTSSELPNMANIYRYSQSSLSDTGTTGSHSDLMPSTIKPYTFIFAGDTMRIEYYFETGTPSTNNTVNFKLNSDTTDPIPCPQSYFLRLYITLIKTDDDQLTAYVSLLADEITVVEEAYTFDSLDFSQNIETYLDVYTDTGTPITATLRIFNFEPSSGG